MTRPLSPAGFARPRLIRLLAGLAVGDDAEARRCFAERLGEWLGLTDAIALAGALGSVDGRPAEAGIDIDAAAELAQVRAVLTRAIVGSEGGEGKRANGGDAAPPAPAGFAAHRQRHAARQREMAAAIAPLRARARQAVSARPSLARLAALDAVFEQALAERERHLLALVPQLLERRFESLRTTAGGDWPSVFARELRDVLLAELEFRLQPVDGLVAALKSGAGAAGRGAPSLPESREARPAGALAAS